MTWQIATINSMSSLTWSSRPPRVCQILLHHHSNPFEIKSFAFGFPHLDELNSLYCRDQHSLSIYLQARWFVPSSSSIYNLPRFDSTNYQAVYINTPLLNRGGWLSLNHPNADITLFVAICCDISKFAKVPTNSLTNYYLLHNRLYGCDSIIFPLPFLSSMVCTVKIIRH